MSRTVSTGFIFLLVCSAMTFSETLTYTDLIGRLTDLEQVARLPSEGELCRLWSSYDRKSAYDEATGTYVNWDANGDGFGGSGWIRIEEGKLVLAEMEGPGCIGRIWSATPRNGHVRIYLDGSPTPAVDLPFVDYFNRTHSPFDRPSLVYTAASGKNNYVPIPFQKSCKIIADKNYGEFHHFTCTLFPEGTIVPTFTMQLSAEDSAALDRADKRLSNCGPDFAADRYPSAITEKRSFTVEAGKAGQSLVIDGARAITSLKVHLPGLPDDIEQQRQLMRELVLSITWDDDKTPAVWCPLGDFFGTAPGINHYKSLPLGMTEEVFYSNWFMPFSGRAVIAIANDGAVNRPVELEVSHTALEKPIDRYARFHAKWHRNAFLPQAPERWIDWTMLTTQGTGRFVGVELQIWNPRGGWWGEGDEKFFVDGEKFPSSFGTGSEDYFGYAWSDPALFAAPYHSQTISENNKGHISNNRWHIVDNVPFQTSFEGYIEKYWSDTKPTVYTCMAYWYLNSGGTDPYPPVELSQRLGYYAQLTYPLDIAGIVVLEKPAGQVEAQGMQSYRAAKWVGGDQLWWTPEKIGDKLLLAMEAQSAGDWRILTRLTQAADYGIVQFSLDGKKIGDPIDLFNKDAVTATGEIDLGVHTLKLGRNVLTVEIAGANPDAIKRYMFGMDYLTLKSPEQTTPTPQPPFTAGEFVRIYDPSVGEHEPWYINDHCFIKGRDGKWHLFGITRQEPASPADEDNFAHAVSDTLNSTTGWVKQPFALTTDPAAGEAHLWAPYVIEHEGLYYMYYCAGGRTSQEYQLKLATSEDLFNWKRHPANPMVIDGFDARDPFILRLEDKWIMYYTATSDPKKGNHVVCTVESNDLIRWANKKVVFVDPSIGTWGGPTESPFVVRRGDYYYLSIGPRDGYRGTCVYRSRDPFHWTIEQEVGRIDSHAAEVIRDVDGTWYVSHCGWGQGGVFLAPLTWNDGADDNDTSLLPSAAKTAISAPTQVVRIPMSVYRDKMIAGWLGQMVAVAWGAPVEFKYLGTIMPETDIPAWKPAMVNDAFQQDDLYVEMTFLRTLEEYGLNASGRQAGIDFANSQYPLWHANDAGRTNLRRGIAPPDSGHPQFNSHADDIDYQIEADFAGLISPALANHAVALGNTFGRLVNYGDGLYGGHFVAALYSIAFTENDPERIVTEALKYIPADSQYARTIRDVLAWYHQYPDDWTRSWEQINQKYQLNRDYRRFSCDKGKFNIDAKINGAYIVMGLLYGRKDIENTIRISMQCGQDSDCNPSNAAGILFTTIGLEKLPTEYKAFDKTTKFIHTPYDLPGLFEVCEVLAQQAVLKCGGAVETDPQGRQVLVIPIQAPRPNPLEQCFAPGPIADSRYTPDEQAKIQTGIKISADPLAPGWTIHNCGPDMSPGFYETVQGKTSVLLTHPLDQSTGCSLVKEAEIPKEGKTVLELSVGRHPEGDWTLVVNAGKKEILKTEISKENAPEGFMDITVDLSAYAGRTVSLELVNQPNGWAWEGAYWDRIEIVTR